MTRDTGEQDTESVAVFHAAPTCGRGARWLQSFFGFHGTVGVAGCSSQCFRVSPTHVSTACAVDNSSTGLRRDRHTAASVRVAQASPGVGQMGQYHYPQFAAALKTRLHIQLLIYGHDAAMCADIAYSGIRCTRQVEHDRWVLLPSSERTRADLPPLA
jgi:hypothetical protein